MYYYLLTGACLLLTGGSYAQSISPNVFSTAGTTFQNNSVRIEQTIGEPLTRSFISGSNTLTQGFEQPFASSVGTDEWQAAQVELFPNPAVGSVTVKVPASVYDSYGIYDDAGRVVGEGTIVSDEFSISLTNYQKATYYLLLKGKITTALTFIKH